MSLLKQSNPVSPMTKSEFIKKFPTAQYQGVTGTFFINAKDWLIFNESELGYTKLRFRVATNMGEVPALPLN